MTLSSYFDLSLYINSEQRKRYKKGKMRPDHLDRLVRVGFNFCPRADEVQKGSDPRYHGFHYEIPTVEIDADGGLVMVDGEDIAETVEPAADAATMQDDLYDGVDENCDDFMLVDFHDETDLSVLDNHHHDGASPSVFGSIEKKSMALEDLGNLATGPIRPGRPHAWDTLHRPGVWSPVTFKLPKQPESAKMMAASMHPPQSPAVNDPSLLQTIRACLPPPFHPSTMTNGQHKQDAAFNDMLERLKAYKAIHGNTKVPRDYQDAELGEWVNGTWWLCVLGKSCTRKSRSLFSSVSSYC